MDFKLPAGIDVKGNYIVHNCDICGCEEAAEIAVLNHYTNGQPIHVCRQCGFIFVRRRRSAASIADMWSEEIYEKGYTARIPAIKARQIYVAEFLDTTVGLAGKSLCDIGGGEGQFLEIIRKPEYGAQVLAIEPSGRNCGYLSDAGIDNFQGTIEDYIAEPSQNRRQFDIVTVMWTLENCASCRAMLDAAYEILTDNGVLLISTGSRILVPFKKPLHYYIAAERALDSHAFRFSANTLRGLFAVGGFEIAHVNRYIDSDILCMIGRKTDRSRPIPWTGDDPDLVLDFFERWHKDTAAHYAAT